MGYRLWLRSVSLDYLCVERTIVCYAVSQMTEYGKGTRHMSNVLGKYYSKTCKRNFGEQNIKLNLNVIPFILQILANLASQVVCLVGNIIAKCC